MSEDETTTAHTSEAEARTRRWMDEAVIGLNLCPFAAAPARRGQVRVAVCAEVDAVLGDKGSIEAADPKRLTRKKVDANDVRCPDGEAAEKMAAAIDAAMRIGLRSAELMEWGVSHARAHRPD